MNTISIVENHSDTSSEQTRTPHPVMNYQQYYTNQVGGGQFIYTGRRYQRGHGLGNLLDKSVQDSCYDVAKDCRKPRKGRPEVRRQCRFTSSDRHRGWCTGKKSRSNDTLLRKVDNW